MLATDVSKWRQQRHKQGLTWMTLASAWRCVRARGGAWRRMIWSNSAWRCVGRVISGTEPLSGMWGCVQSPTASWLSWVCRSTQDDLCGTFKTVIGAIFATVMQTEVVCAVWNSLTMVAAGSKPKDDSWMTSEVQRQKAAVTVMMAEAMLKKESH